MIKPIECEILKQFQTLSFFYLGENNFVAILEPSSTILYIRFDNIALFDKIFERKTPNLPESINLESLLIRKDGYEQLLGNLNGLINLFKGYLDEIKFTNIERLGELTGIATIPADKRISLVLSLSEKDQIHFHSKGSWIISCSFYFQLAPLKKFFPKGFLSLSTQEFENHFGIRNHGFEERTYPALLMVLPT